MYEQLSGLLGPVLDRRRWTSIHEAPAFDALTHARPYTKAWPVALGGRGGRSPATRPSPATRCTDVRLPAQLGLVTAPNELLYDRLRVAWNAPAVGRLIYAAEIGLRAIAAARRIQWSLRNHVDGDLVVDPFRPVAAALSEQSPFRRESGERHRTDLCGSRL
jgi:hypothetical protein